MEKISYYNNEVLKWARLYSKTTEYELDTRFKNQVYLEWEKKTKLPTYKQLEALIGIYGFPIAILFFPQPPKLKSVEGSFRTLPKYVIDSLGKDTVKLINTARYYQISLSEMYIDEAKDQESILNFNLNTSDVLNLADQIKSIFSKSPEIFKRNRSAKDLLEYWREIFFEFGIYVFKDSFKEKSISGFCLYDKINPVIYVNNKMSFTRQLFTLFHELYHLLSGVGGIDFLNDDFISTIDNYDHQQHEFRCNSFAAEFLVPTEEFKSQILYKEINQELISVLSRRFCVSREVILRKLFDLKEITFEYYLEYKENYNVDYFRNNPNEKTKPGGNYFNTQMSYRGERYIELAYSNYYNGKSDIFTLSDHMNMKIPHLQKIANIKGWGEL